MKRKRTKKLVCIMLFVLCLFVFVQTQITQADDGSIQKEDNSQTRITRQEFISLLMIELGETGSKADTKKLKFADKNQIKPELKKYIGAANSLGVLPEIKKNGKTYLKPQAPLTMQMAAYYMGRCLGFYIDLNAENIELSNKASKSCMPYVTALLNSGLLSLDGTAFNPKKLMTWAEAEELVETGKKQGYFRLSSILVYAGGSTVGTKESDGALFHVTGITKGEKNDVIYVADTFHNQIKAVVNGKISVLAGKITQKDETGRCLGGYVDGSLTEAVFNRPAGIRAVKNGILVADTGNHVIRYVDLQKKTVTTYAGTGKAGFRNGSRTQAAFSCPEGIDMAKDGTVYIADTGNDCIRAIDKNGNVTTLAGQPNKKGYKDGAGSMAEFNKPMGIIADNGNLYVADCGNQRIRKIAKGIVTTEAGSGTNKYENTENFMGGFRNGPASQARFHNPVNLTIDKQGNLYVSDEGNHMIRKIQEGHVYTAAGFGVPANQKQFSWDDYLVSPAGLFVSADDGRLYAADLFKNHIFSISVK